MNMKVKEKLSLKNSFNGFDNSISLEKDEHKFENTFYKNKNVY